METVIVGWAGHGQACPGVPSVRCRAVAAAQAAGVMSMEIAILGAGGFIGSHLVEHLAATSSHHVTGVDVSSRKLAGVPDASFTFRHGDVRKDRALIDAVIRDADIVVDLIAYANPSRYVTAPLEVFDLNFLQNLEIARSCIAHGKRLVQYSSAE